MATLSIPLSRSKIAQIFKEEFSLPYANSFTKLIQFDNGKIAWLYSSPHNAQRALYYSKENYHCLRIDENLPNYKIINRDDYFTFNGNLYRCSSKSPSQLLICSVKQILKAEEAKKITKNKTEFSCYKVTDKQGSIVNLAWISEDKKARVLVFQQEKFDFKNKSVTPMEFAEEVKISLDENERPTRWMYHTEKGSPILRELSGLTPWR